jgi:hypothetical protein
VTRICSIRWACFSMKPAAPTARHCRKHEKEMAEARPSKVGAVWSAKVWWSISSGSSPPLFSASASVTPAMPAPATITSVSAFMAGHMPSCPAAGQTGESVSRLSWNR